MERIVTVNRQRVPVQEKFRLITWGNDLHLLNLPQSRVAACHEHHLSLANAHAMSAQSKATSQGTYKLPAATHVAGSRLTEPMNQKHAKQTRIQKSDVHTI